MEKTSRPAVQGSTDLSAYNNEWYKPGPGWKRFLWFVVSPLVVYNHLPIPSPVRVAVLKLFGARIGRGTVIKPGVNIKYPWFLRVGQYVWIGENVWIDNLTEVVIGDHACLSQGAMLLTGNHNYRRRAFDLIVKSIHLENGVWIGAQAVVCPGITCHSHAMLAVGSVATRHLEAYGIYQGNPAVWIKKREIKE
ncbi:WcaF family extracellular polysaccharide biosynthesis acetyltransferase [Larkinella soli]|uniref:WcaF family extracellular polysaccharide biosynthesis acetyltransferase n=1 Tax=Larkinella soli TaxID=1770527 RepID=UPI000FFC54E7|nr:WcaF family extracellular polysaccharide biosynthesis acetyltransferase [Larkinella soli]